MLRIITCTVCISPACLKLFSKYHHLISHFCSISGRCHKSLLLIWIHYICGKINKIQSKSKFVRNRFSVSFLFNSLRERDRKRDDQLDFRRDKFGNCKHWNSDKYCAKFQIQSFNRIFWFLDFSPNTTVCMWWSSDIWCCLKLLGAPHGLGRE